MSKYGPLRDHLQLQSGDEVTMTFAEIEALVGNPLPPSAYRYREWWSNNPSGSSITRAWLAAGFKSTQVDMAGRTLIFRRTSPRPYAPAARDEPAGVADASAAYAVGGRHPIFGALKGAIAIGPTTDLTAPADPDWGAAE